MLREVAASYGINAAVDDSVDRKTLRFDLENVTYKKAMGVLLSMTHAFASPLDSIFFMQVDRTCQEAT